MSKKLLIPVVVFVCIMAVFIACVAITEGINTDNLQKNYVAGGEDASNDIVTVPAPSDLAVKYQRSKVITWIVRLLWGIVVPAFFLFSGLSAALRNWAQRKSKRKVLIIALYFIAYSIIDYMLNLPIDYFGDYARKHAYGLSNQAFDKWIGDSLKGFFISTMIGALLIWIPYTLIRKYPVNWWLYMGLLYVPFLLFMSFVSPVLLDPVFNKYVPMEDKALESSIYKLIDRTTVKDCRVYQVNKSVDTKEMNAYMTGILNSKRIVLWDTTVKKLGEKEIICVVAHEMGHYLMGHVWKSILISGVLCIIVLYFVNRCALWLINASRGAFGFRKLQDIASLPLLILLINIFMFITAPGVSAYSRHMEVEADRFEVELTRDNHASASAMVKLHEQSLGLPEPGLIYMLWNYDHPTFRDRVNFFNSYKPWKYNKPIKYQKFIKQ